MWNIVGRIMGRATGRPQSKSKATERTESECKGDYTALLQMTLRDWLLRHQQDIIFNKCSWMGVPTVKNPLDAWVYQEIIFEVKPDVIVEIGSFKGGSTIYFAHLLDLLGKGEVVSVDVDRTHYEAQHDRIVTVTGDSSSDEVVNEVAGRCEGKTVLVVHDGDHAREQVAKDLATYSKFVSPNSYFIVEDGIVDLFESDESLGLHTDGPLVAVDDFLRDNPDFAADRERERYILTYNPRGFLRRVR